MERWGGIGYGVAAAAAALEGAWAVRPLVKVGSDLASPARDFLATIPGVDGSALRVVSEPNNRVELRYRDDAERTEVLSGGGPPWEAAALVDALAGCDALLINFVSGREATLRTCRAVRAAFGGPIYADLHSLFLGIAPDGTRLPRPLPDFRSWTACFDAVQLNEDEARLAAPGTDPRALLESLIREGRALAAVTLGSRGAAWSAAPSTVDGGGLRTAGPAPGPGGGRVESGSVTIGAPRRGDPTGCGDVWGAAFFSRILRGDPVPEAAGVATRLAARSVEHTGAEGLYQLLHAEVVS